MLLRVRTVTTVLFLVLGLVMFLAGLFWVEWPAVVFGVFLIVASLYILN